MRSSLSGAPSCSLSWSSTASSSFEDEDGSSQGTVWPLTQQGEHFTDRVSAANNDMDTQKAASKEYFDVSKPEASSPVHVRKTSAGESNAQLLTHKPPFTTTDKIYSNGEHQTFNNPIQRPAEVTQVRQPNDGGEHQPIEFEYNQMRRPVEVTQVKQGPILSTQVKQPIGGGEHQTFNYKNQNPAEVTQVRQPNDGSELQTFNNQIQRPAEVTQVRQPNGRGEHQQIEFEYNQIRRPVEATQVKQGPILSTQVKQPIGCAEHQTFNNPIQRPAEVTQVRQPNDGSEQQPIESKYNQIRRPVEVTQEKQASMLSNEQMRAPSARNYSRHLNSEGNSLASSAGSAGSVNRRLDSASASGMRQTTSLQLLPLARDANETSFREESNKEMWEYPTTAHRTFRYFLYMLYLT